jgi:curved DNA-binding protein
MSPPAHTIDPMAKKDFYEVLGVARSATADEIRRAYRKLARQFHPDVNKAKDAQAKFTQVQEAYDTLSDEQKRKRYDRYGTAEPESAAAASAGQPRYSWTNVAGGRPGAGFDQSELDSETLGSMFDAFFGGRAEEMSGRRPRASRAAPRTRGADAEAELEVSFLTAMRGGTERFRVTQGGKARTIDVTIPKGIADGAKLRIKGAGDSGPKEPGDLILTIRVQPHPLFKRGAEAPLDLRLELPLTIAEATLGATVAVPTFHGLVELTIPPGTSSGQRFRLKGRGVETEAGQRGDLYVLTRIVTPAGADLPREDQDKLRAIAAQTPDPRAGDLWRKV